MKRYTYGRKWHSAKLLDFEKRCVCWLETLGLAGHRECMGNSKRVLRRSISWLRGKTNCLHALIIAARRIGVFISEFRWPYCIWCVVSID